MNGLPTLLAAAAASVMAAGAAVAQPAVPTANAPVQNPGARPKLLHVYATPDGESHIEEISVSPNAGDLPLTGLRALSYNPTNVTWHNAPSRQFAINLTGVLEVELSDGAKRRIGPGDLVLLDDTTGKGHVTRLVSPVTCLFIRVADGFDVRKWAAGESR
jgi:hypothetical protein